MIYQHDLALLKQKDWQLPDQMIREWRESGFIPDTYALHSNPYTTARRRWYKRLLALAGDGWLNSEAVCRHYGWPKTRLSNILSFQRDPDSKAIRMLYGEEIDQLRVDLLQPMQRQVRLIVSAMSRVPTDQPVPTSIQKQIVKLMANPLLNEGRFRQEMIASDSEKIRNVVRGKRSLLTRLSDKPLLVRLCAGLQGIKELLSLEPDKEGDAPETAPIP